MASDINIRIGASITDLQKKLRKAEYSLKRSGNKMKSLGSDLMMGLSAPIGLFGVAAVKAAGDFEASMNGMKAVTAGGIDMFDELEATAKRLGATTQFSATEAAAGMEMLGRNGLTAQQILDGAAEASLTLAAATGTDLGNAANIATDAMAQFNLEANQLGTTADIITGATVNSKFGIDDFMNAMAQAGGVAGAVGVSFDDFATTVSAISPSFNSGADAGTSLKTMLTRLVPESKNAADMMRQLGIITADGSNQFFDAEGNMKSMSEVAGILQTAFAGLSEEQRIQASKTLFGTDAMRAGLKLAETGSATYDNLKESIMGVAAADVAETRMEGFNGAILRLKSAFEALQLAVADSGIQEVATMLIESLTGIFLRLAELNPETLKLITIIGGVVAAIPPMIFAFGAAKVAMGNAMGITSDLIKSYRKLIVRVISATMAQTGLNIAMSANVIGLVVLAIAALAAGLTYAYKNFEGFRNIVDSVMNNFLKPLATFIFSLYKIWYEVFSGIVKIVWNWYKMVAGIWIALAKRVMDFLSRIPIIGKVFSGLKRVFSNVINFISKAWNNLPALFAGLTAEAENTAILVQAFFTRLALTAQIVAKKVSKALTIDKSERQRLAKEIKDLSKERDAAGEAGKAFGESFREAFDAALDGGDIVEEVTGDEPITIPPIGGGDEDGEKGKGGKKIGDITGDAAKAAEDEAKALREKNDELDKSAKLIDNSKTKQIEYNNNVEKATMLNEGMARSLAGLQQSQQQVDDYHESRTFKIMEGLRERGKNAAQWVDNFNQAIEDLANGIKSVMEGAIEDLAVNIGEGIGAMAAGVSSAKDLGKVLLGQLAGVLGQLGKLAIAAGITMLNIQKMFEAGLVGGPATAALAIGAGIALVALSKFAQSKIESMGSGGGEVNGGNGVPALANGGIVSAPTLSLIGEAGPEAVIPLSKMNSMFGGGGDSLKVDFPMDKMVIALDRQRRRNSRV